MDAGPGGMSAYMRDMVDKLTFIRNEILARFNVGDLMKTWCVLVYRRDELHTANMTNPLIGSPGQPPKACLYCEARHQDFCLARFARQTSERRR